MRVGQRCAQVVRPRGSCVFSSRTAVGRGSVSLICRPPSSASSGTRAGRPKVCHCVVASERLYGRISVVCVCAGATVLGRRHGHGIARAGLQCEIVTLAVLGLGWRCVGAVLLEGCYDERGLPFEAAQQLPRHRGGRMLHKLYGTRGRKIILWCCGQGSVKVLVGVVMQFLSKSWQGIALLGCNSKRLAGSCREGVLRTF